MIRYLIRSHLIGHCLHLQTDGRDQAWSDAAGGWSDGLPTHWIRIDDLVRFAETKGFGPLYILIDGKPYRILPPSEEADMTVRQLAELIHQLRKVQKAAGRGYKTETDHGKAAPLEKRVNAALHAILQERPHHGHDH